MKTLILLIVLASSSAAIAGTFPPGSNVASAYADTIDAAQSIAHADIVPFSLPDGSVDPIHIRYDNTETGIVVLASSNLPTTHTTINNLTIDFDDLATNAEIEGTCEAGFNVEPFFNYHRLKIALDGVEISPSQGMPRDDGPHMIGGNAVTFYKVDSTDHGVTVTGIIIVGANGVTHTFAKTKVDMACFTTPVELTRFEIN